MVPVARRPDRVRYQLLASEPTNERRRSSNGLMLPIDHLHHLKILGDVIICRLPHTSWWRINEARLQCSHHAVSSGRLPAVSRGRANQLHQGEPDDQ